jgi:exodeoxyribonuclease V alpha subunit
MNLSLSQEQQDAVDLCADLSHRLVCVTGPAGTGKTTILKEVYKEINQQLPLPPTDSSLESFICLAAPTGRAAKRIEEATNIPAVTIHRMMRYTTPEKDGDETLPQHNKQNPLPYRVVLIDEASMLDTTLWRNVLDALLRGAVIRFFGDINQLPPVVGKVSPFKQAMDRFPTQILTHNYRSDDGIISISNKIINGKLPTANEQANFFRIKSADVMFEIKRLCQEVDFTKMHSQIISPTNKTKFGCAAINLFIQQRFNPEKEKITTYQKDPQGDVLVQSFKRNDKIIWTKNDYTLGIMNGTLGVVKDFDDETGEIVLTLDGDNDIIIPPSIRGFNPSTGQEFTYDPRNYIMLGYAITTHKSQGSQFDTVLYVITRSRAATRQNVYTAATRAKTKLVVLNVNGCLSSALSNVAEI